MSESGDDAFGRYGATPAAFDRARKSAWIGLGRGETSVEGWAELRKEAARAHNKSTARYLLGTPLLGDFLEEGLSMLGRSCEEFELNRL